MKRAFLVLLILAAFGLRVHQLDSFSFWQDEGLTPLRAGYSIREIISNEVTIQEAVTQDTHPPLYFLLIHLTKQMLGESDFAYRFPSVLAGVLLIPLLFQFGCIISGRKAGVIAAVLATFNPLQIWYSQEARMYTLLVLFATIASYALWRGLNSKKVLRWLAIYILFAGLAFLTHYTAIFLIAFQAILWFWLLWKRGQRRLIIGAAILGLLILIPFIPFTIPRIFSGAEYNYFYVSPLIMLQDVVHGFGMGFTANFSQISIRLLDIFVAIILILGIIGSYRLSGGWLLPIFLVGYLLSVVVGLALGSLIKPMYQGIRHIIAGSSAFIILLALGVVSVPKRPRWLPSATMAVLLLGPLISLNNFYNNSHFAKDEIRELIAYIEERAGDRDIVVYNNAILMAFHWHYRQRDDLPVTALPIYPHPANEDTIDQLGELSDQYERLWFIKDPPPVNIDDSHLVESWLKENLLLIDRGNTRARTMVLQVDGYSTISQLPSSLPEEAEKLLFSQGTSPNLSGFRTAFDQPATLPTLWFDLYWDIDTPPEEADQLRFILKDPSGQVWVDDNQPFAYGDYQYNGLGGLARFSYGLSIPDGLPPGDYSLHLQQWDGVSGQPTGEQLSLGTIAFGKSDEWPLQQEIDFETSGSLNFENGYQLLGLANTSAEVRPGHSLPIFLYWQSSSYDPEARYEFELVGPDGEVWDQNSSSPGTEWLTGSAWQDDTIIREIVGLFFPADAEPGRYRMRWRMTGADGVIPGRTSWRPWSTEWVNYGTIELQPWPLVTELPQAKNVVNAEFGSDIVLFGFDLPETEVSPGDALDLRLHWQAMVQPIDDLFVFVHLISPVDGAIVSQLDRIPADWLRPTPGWRPGEFIVDEYELLIPDNVPSGSYQLYTGMFDPETLIRRPVVYRQERQPDDRFQLPSISIVP